MLEFKFKISSTYHFFFFYGFEPCLTFFISKVFVSFHNVTKSRDGVRTPGLVKVKDELHELCLVIVDNTEYLLDSRFMHTVITYHCPKKLKGEKVYSSFPALI